MPSYQDVHYAGDPTIIKQIPGRGVIWAAGDTVPSDAVAGYAPGCIFQHLDGAAGATIYVNEGTLASCDFDAVTVG